MKTHEEVAKIYWCRNCRSRIESPRWDETKGKHGAIFIAYCPQCSEEVARRLKTNEQKSRQI